MTTQVAPIVGPSAQNSLLKIQKATIKKQLLSAEFTEQLTLEAKPRNFQVQTDELVHPDLEACFAKLVPHFTLLTEQLDEHNQYTDSTTNSGYWPEPGEKLPQHFDGYSVTGIIMSSKADGGVTLMGFRTMESGMVQNMTAQFVTFAEQVEGSDAWRYKHTDELQGAVEMAIEEVELALRGKCSDAGRQLNMFDAEQNKEEVIAEFGEVTKNYPAPKKRKANRIADK